MESKKNQPRPTITNINMEGTMNTIDSDNIDDELSFITEFMMQAASPQPAKRISKP